MATSYKIVFMGPVGAGKTEAIKVLSDIEVVATEARATDQVALRKRSTTVAMDYGVLNLSSGDRVRLYGTPGQARFEFMWEILSENALGVVLLLDASAPDPLLDLRNYVNAFWPVIQRSTLVVGITHADTRSERVLRPAVADELGRLGLPAVVLTVDARVRAQMCTLVKTLIYSLDPLYDAA